LGTCNELALINKSLIKQIIGQNENDFLFSKIQYDLTEKRVNLLFERIYKQEATVSTKDPSSSQKIRYNCDSKDETQAIQMEDLLPLPLQITNMDTNQTCNNSAMSKIEASLNPNDTNSVVNKEVEKENQPDDESQIELYRLPTQMIQFVRKLYKPSPATNTDISACRFLCGLDQKIFEKLTIIDTADLLKEVHKLEVNKNESLFVFEITRKNETSQEAYRVCTYVDLFEN
jgi:hypothetical protein